MIINPKKDFKYGHFLPLNRSPRFLTLNSHHWATHFSQITASESRRASSAMNLSSTAHFLGKMNSVQVAKVLRNSSYTGYIDIEARHIFFYFFESRSNPDNDDVIFWTNGGWLSCQRYGQMVDLIRNQWHRTWMLIVSGTVYGIGCVSKSLSALGMGFDGNHFVEVPVG